MSIETDLYDVLNNLAPAYPVFAPPEATVPCFTYRVVGGTDAPAYDGNGAAAQSRRLRVDAWAGAYGDARSLSDQAREATYAALTVGKITDKPSCYDAAAELYRVSFDVEAWA